MTARACMSFLCLAAACGGGEDAARLQVERDTLGDTLVVRTVAGSVWGPGAVLEPEVRIGVFEGEDHYMFGEIRSLTVGPDGSIYVMDGQVPALRKYAPDGAYVTTFGREGGGPGEYRQPDGGLVALADGRVVLRDPANARLQVYSADGEPLDTWPIRGGFSTGSPLVADTAHVYSTALLDPEADIGDWRQGMVAYSTLDGAPGDTLPMPEWDYESPRLTASSSSGENRSISITGVPFTPGSHSALSPLGYMVGGVSTRYAIDQFLPDGTVLRIERAAETIPVQPDEKANAEEQTVWNMRQTQPDWTWDGPPIPETKPAFRRVSVALDGRIWVMVHQPAVPIPEEEIEVVDAPQARPPDRWREPVAYDVFEPEGTYLGRVVAPRGFSRYPRPVFRGDQVWAVVRDELDVPYVTRFRVTPSDAAPEGGAAEE